MPQSNDRPSERTNERTHINTMHSTFDLYTIVYSSFSFELSLFLVCGYCGQKVCALEWFSKRKFWRTHKWRLRIKNEQNHFTGAVLNELDPRIEIVALTIPKLRSFSLSANEMIERQPNDNDFLKVERLLWTTHFSHRVWYLTLDDATIWFKHFCFFIIIEVCKYVMNCERFTFVHTVCTHRIIFEHFLFLFLSLYFARSNKFGYTIQLASTGCTRVHCTYRYLFLCTKPSSFWWHNDDDEFKKPHIRTTTQSGQIIKIILYVIMWPRTIRHISYIYTFLMEYTHSMNK